MTKRVLKLIVARFTKGLLNGRESTQMCFVVCAPLVGYLNAIGVKSRIVHGEFAGENHVWIETEDGTVIDPTIKQFDKGFPNVYIGPRLQEYSV